MEAVAMETASMEAATVETATVETATVETATVETATVEAAGMEAAGMEAATSVETAASVKPTAPTMGTSVGEACLAERRSEQQSSCGSRQNPSHFGLNSFFA
jgi:hypothetical protein